MDKELVSSISAKEKQIGKVFGGDYLFEIPLYQRPYAWEEEQALQLLDDIKHFAFKPEEFEVLPPYFLGSIVIIKSPNNRLSKVVDGQQRLTTLTILLSVLRYLIEDNTTKSDLKTLIFQTGSTVMGTSDSYRLKTRERDQFYFNTIIQQEKGLENIETNLPNHHSESQQRMYENAVGYIAELTTKEYGQDELTKLASYIIQRCFIVIVSTTDEESAFRIFNVLNDRGMQLTTADILKSEILEKIPENEQGTYNTIWEECEEELGIDGFKDLFSNIRAIVTKKKAEESVLKEIRTYAKPGETPKQFIDEIISPYGSVYNYIIKSKCDLPSKSDEINKCLKSLNFYSHSDWIPPAILFCSKYNQTPELIYQFLKQLERLTLGMEIMRVGLNKRLKRYFELIQMIEDNIDVMVPNSIFYFSDSEQSEIQSGLQLPKFYGKRYVKNVLLKIDEHLSDGTATYDYPVISIEHVLPQNPSSDSYWNSIFSPEEKEDLTNQLGNLVLLSKRKNSRASNYEFLVKIEKYFKGKEGASAFLITRNVEGHSDWTAEVIKRRTIELTNFILEELQIEELIVPASPV